MACADCISHAKGALPLYEKMLVREDGQPQPLPLSGSIELTLRCNLRCRHCYILFPGATSNELNTEQMKSILDKDNHHILQQK